MSTNVVSLAEFDNIQAQISPGTELIVLFFFDKRHADGSRMERYVNAWSKDPDFKDRVLFVKCNKENSDHDIFEKYDVKAISTFLFFKDHEQAAPSSTGTVEEIEVVINDLLADKK